MLFFMFSLVRESGSHNPLEQLLCLCECKRSPLGQLGRRRLGIVSCFSDCNSVKGQLPRSLLGKFPRAGWLSGLSWHGGEIYLLPFASLFLPIGHTILPPTGILSTPVLRPCTCYCSPDIENPSYNMMASAFKIFPNGISLPSPPPICLP